MTARVMYDELPQRPTGQQIMDGWVRIGGRLKRFGDLTGAACARLADEHAERAARFEAEAAILERAQSLVDRGAAALTAEDLGILKQARGLVVRDRLERLRPGRRGASAPARARS